METVGPEDRYREPVFGENPALPLPSEYHSGASARTPRKREVDADGIPRYRKRICRYVVTGGTAKVDRLSSLYGAEACFSSSRIPGQEVVK